MKTIVHTAATRGGANHGWLQANHSFSFANYYNPERMGFGTLRVLNDDVIAPGMGFGMHPHDNMEIITIPLEGALVHKDSMGNSEVVNTGDVQVMSAGSGVQHSEFNNSATAYLRLFQIWIFTKHKNVTPRYQQISIDAHFPINTFQTIVAPAPLPNATWVHQDCWLNIITLHNATVNYNLNLATNGVYVMVISGSIIINNQSLQDRDAMGITGTATFDISCTQEAKVLLIEIPM
jgi:quercetin 2,3-dioxygenase